MKKYKDEVLGEEMYETMLSCGMRGIFIPLNTDVSMSMFNLFTRFGSIDAKFKNHKGKVIEVPDGTAHFLEHCAFYDPDGKNAMHELASFGLQANGWTSFDHTNYLFHGGIVERNRAAYYTKFKMKNKREDEKKRNLDYLISFVANPYFTDEVVKKEKDVISREIAMGQDSPGSVLWDYMQDALIQKHPFRRLVAGKVETIMKITKEGLHSAYNTFYYPSNLCLVMLVPSKDPEEGAKEHFDLAENICNSKGFVYKKPPEYVYPEEPAEVNKKLVTTEHNVTNPIVKIGFKGKMDLKGTAEERMKDSVTCELLTETLFSQSSKEIYGLIDSEVCKEDIGGGYYSGRGFSVFSMASSTTNPEAFLDEAINLIKDGVNGKLSRELFDLKKKGAIKAQASLLEMEHLEGLGATVIHTLAADLKPVDYMKSLLSVTYEEIIEAGKKYLDTDNYSVVVMNPRK
ncbi:MAG: pitrilysin family protein [Candidatus Woesearchaeota archaeon]